MFPKAYIQVPNLYLEEFPNTYSRNIFVHLQNAPWEVKRNIRGIPVCLIIRLDKEDNLFYLLDEKDKEIRTGSISDYFLHTLTIDTIRVAFHRSDSTRYIKVYGVFVEQEESKPQFVIHDIWFNGGWLGWSNVKLYAKQLGYEVVPYYGIMTLNQADALFQFTKRTHPDFEFVLTCMLDIQTTSGDRIMAKLV